MPRKARLVNIRGPINRQLVFDKYRGRYTSLPSSITIELDITNNRGRVLIRGGKRRKIKRFNFGFIENQQEAESAFISMILYAERICKDKERKKFLAFKKEKTSEYDLLTQQTE